MRHRATVLATLWCTVAILVVLVFATGGLRSGPRRGGTRETGARGEPTRDVPAPSTVRPGGAGAPLLFGRTDDPHPGQGAVLGRVLDVATGRPVASAHAILSGTGHRGESVHQEERSGADGTFAFRRVPAGLGYTLRVEAAPLGSAVPFVDVRAGGVADLGTIWLGTPTALEGRVVDGRGRGVAGAEVSVHRGAGALSRVLEDFAERVSTLDREESPVARAESEGDGRFRIEALDPGPVTLLVRAKGYALAVAKASVVARSAGAAPIRIVLETGAGVAGRVVEEDGAPIDGARIAVMSGDDPDAFLYGRTFARTGADGSFRVDAVPGSGDLTAVVAAAGYPTTFASLRPGEQSAEIVLHRVAVLDVFVVGTSGTGVSDARVVLAIGDRPTVEEQPATIVSGTTDADGRLRLEARAGALQMAMVTHADYGSALWTPGAPEDPPGALQGPDDPAIPPGGRTLRLGLADAVVVTGRVTSAATGEPVVAARVSAMSPLGLGQPALTDAQGRYVLLASVTSSGPPALVVVRASGYVQPPQTMAVRSDPTAPGRYPHDVPLAVAGSVGGLVTDTEGRPVAGAAVTVVESRSRDGGRFASLLGQPRAYTGDDGRYLLDGVSPMRAAIVVAEVPGFPSGASAPFAVKPAANTAAPVLVLGSGATAEVRVTSADGAAVPGARVVVYVDSEEKVALDAFAASRPDAVAEADASGVARLTGLPAGAAEVVVRARGFAAGSLVFQVPAGAASVPRLEVRLEPAVALAGRVTNAAGHGLAGAQVRASRSDAGDDAEDDASTLRAVTDDRGAFRFEDAPDAPLEVTALHREHEAASLALERPRTDVEIRLLPESPETVRRRAEIQDELRLLSDRLRTATSDADRAAHRARAQELLRALEGLRTGRADGR